MSRPGYAAAAYDAMFADPIRRGAYLEAIRRVVRPDDVVVEVGTGFGYFAVAAAQAGARHVYTIERSPAMAVAEAVVRANGLAERVTCIRGDAREVALPQRGTVLLCDLRGVIPWYGDAIATIVSVRERLLVPTARWIPRRDDLFAAPCVSPRAWKATHAALLDPQDGISRHAGAAYSRSVPCRDVIGRRDLLAPGRRVARLDYATVRSPDVDGELDWTVARPGRAEGIGLWFKASLAPGVQFSTSPTARLTYYEHGFLPLERPVDVVPGDRLTCRIRLKLTGDGYVTAWDTTHHPASGAPRLEMRQSSLAALMVDAANLGARKAGHVPRVEDAVRVRAVLEQVDGRRSLADISAELAVANPDWFASREDALRWAGRVAAAAAQLSRD